MTKDEDKIAKELKKAADKIPVKPALGKILNRAKAPLDKGKGGKAGGKK
jgi:hypothetical protein